MPEWRNDWEGEDADLYRETPKQRALWFVGILIMLALLAVIGVGGFLVKACLYYEVGKALSGDAEEK